MPQEPFVKNEPHFTLIIHYKDFISFEAALNKSSISYFTEELPLNPSSGIKYFFLDEDRLRLDEIIKHHKIETGLVSSGLADYQIHKKTYKLYLVITVAIGIILYIVSLWD